MRYLSTSFAILLCVSQSFAQRRGPVGGFPALETSNDVAYLEKVASSLDEADKVPGVNHAAILRSPKDARMTAYARLGQLGTAESLAAVVRIEKAAKELKLTPDTVPVGYWTQPMTGDYTGDVVMPLATVKSPEGLTYGVVINSLLARSEIFLISSRTPDSPRSWSRPFATGINAAGVSKLSLTMKENTTLTVAFTRDVRGANAARILADGIQQGPQSQELLLLQLLRDTDGDGWTDLEEQRLGLDPAKADTDGDGIPDGADATPDYASPAVEAGDEKAKIIQLAVFATVGLSGSRATWLVDPEAQKVSLWGLSGPALYKDMSAQWQGVNWILKIGWTIVNNDGAQASVRLTYSEGGGGRASSGRYLVTLRKVGDRWYVISRQLESAAAA